MKHILAILLLTLLVTALSGEVGEHGAFIDGIIAT